MYNGKPKCYINGKEKIKKNLLGKYLQDSVNSISEVGSVDEPGLNVSMTGGITQNTDRIVTTRRPRLSGVIRVNTDEIHERTSRPTQL